VRGFDFTVFTDYSLQHSTVSNNRRNPALILSCWLPFAVVAAVATAAGSMAPPYCEGEGLVHIAIDTVSLFAPQRL
jgi:hypothetical protein